MLCPNCGKGVAETDSLCGSCGSSLTSATAPSPETVKQPSQRSGKAIVSLVLALLSFAAIVEFFDFFSEDLSNRFLLGAVFAGSVAALPAIIFGHLAKAAIRRSSGKIVGKRIATTGLVLGYSGLLVSIILARLCTLPPYYPWGPGNRPVGALRTIDTATAFYASTYNRGFPPTLAALRCPKIEDHNAILVSNEKAACLIGEELASGIKAGYRITYIPGPPDITGKIQTYTVRADPINPGVTGDNHYFTDQSGVIRQKSGGEAGANDSPIAG